jgi:hypothetical protein
MAQRAGEPEGEIAVIAGIQPKNDRATHSARHSIGKYIIEKTGKIAAARRQRGRKNTTFTGCIFLRKIEAVTSSGVFMRPLLVTYLICYETPTTRPHSP